MGAARTRYRRSGALVSYWQGRELVFENYALGTRIGAEPLVCSILHFCSEWRSILEIGSHLGNYEESSVRRVLETLSRSGVLERSDRKRDPRLVAMENWTSWNPAAGFFHFSTKDTDFALDQGDAFAEVKRRAKARPMPLPLKAYPKARRIRMPRLEAGGEFVSVLKSRRTWRKFGQSPITLETLSQVLELTFGIQSWIDVPGLGRAATRTSPSGGALHPIEPYILAQRVKGLRPGIYHYNGQRQELEHLRGAIPKRALEKGLAGQWWFGQSAFFVVMTAVFGRTRWKYDFARSYRVILAEAGHLCQTFCLVATWLGLAPFCTMALSDTTWEQWLRIDGVNESILYIAGAGTLPGKHDQRNANILKMGRRTASD